MKNYSHFKELRLSIRYNLYIMVLKTYNHILNDIFEHCAHI